MGKAERLTVGEALQRASLCLRKAGLEQPRDEAEILLAHLLGWNRLKLFLERSSELPAASGATFSAAVERRARNEPLAYITGEKEFYGLPFAVSPAVLIPRPETELLIDAVLEWARKREGRIKGVDLGCGSGNLAITLAYHLPEAVFCAVDISPEALELAKTNALRHDVHRRIRFVKGDFRQALAFPQPLLRFNLIVSNPPYVESGELEELPATICNYEPLLALDGGPDGLAAYRGILAALPRYLERPGLMALEIGSGQGGALLALCRGLNYFHRLDLLRDYRSLPRIITGLF